MNCLTYSTYTTKLEIRSLLCILRRFTQEVMVEGMQLVQALSILKGLAHWAKQRITKRRDCKDLGLMTQWGCHPPEPFLISLPPPCLSFLLAQQSSSLKCTPLQNDKMKKRVLARGKGSDVLFLHVLPNF